MNKPISQTNFHDDLQNPINVTLVSMQINALTESLKRLVNTEDNSEIELLPSEKAETQAKPDC